MKKITLAHYLKDIKTIGAHPVVCFLGDAYPLLFFSQFFAHIKKDLDAQFVSLDSAQEDTARMRAQLETSFLGQQSVYWLRDMNVFSTKVQREWSGYITHYAGPNSVMLFAGSDWIKKVDNGLIVTIPEIVDAGLFTQLIVIFSSINEARARMFIARVLKHQKKVSLDQACLLISYAQLSGALIKDMCDEWLDSLLVADASLFTLSTHFFARNGKAFFALWVDMQKVYSPQFWIAYWAEQVWRAHWFVHFAQSGKRLEAKKISYRLPFSFIQKDWRMHEIASLKKMHDELYTLDHAMKNSGNSIGFDALFAQYL